VRSTAVHNAYRNFPLHVRYDQAGTWSVQAKSMVHQCSNKRDMASYRRTQRRNTDTRGTSYRTTMHQDVGDIPKQPSRLDRCISMLLGLVQPQSNASPKFAKQDPIPILTHWSCNVFVLTHALWPGVVRKTYEWVHDGENLPFMATVLLYLTAHIYMTVREATVLLHMGAK